MPAENSGTYVGVLKICRELDLAFEPVGENALRFFGRENLDDHHSPKRFFLCQKYARHAATAELAEDRVGGTE